eukprot:1485125-Pleurochrysis_carterae.AAC.1
MELEREQANEGVRLRRSYQRSAAGAAKPISWKRSYSLGGTRGALRRKMVLKMTRRATEAGARGYGLNGALAPTYLHIRKCKFSKLNMCTRARSRCANIPWLHVSILSSILQSDSRILA